MLSQLNSVWRELAAIFSVLGSRDRFGLLWAIARNGIVIASTKSLRSAESDFMRSHDLLKVRAYGHVFRLRQPDLGLVRELYGHGIYFPKPAFVPASGDKVIDLGANVGLFSLLCAGLGAEVLAVEAQSGFAPLAQDNFIENGVQDHVRFVGALVGASKGVFASEASHKNASHWADEPPTLSMDDVLRMFPAPKESGGDIPDIHLLKMDIEGSEFALLDGNLSWLRRFAYISMEVHPEFGDVRSLKDCVQREGFDCELVPSWREKGVPSKYPGYLFATRRTDYKSIGMNCAE